MYKGHNFSKRLERYKGYAQTKYDQACATGSVNLWQILNQYLPIKRAPYCVQMYIYDLVEGRGVYEGCYELVKWSDGKMYVREVVGMVG